MPGAFFRPPGQATTTPGDYNSTPEDPRGKARPTPFAGGNDVNFHVSSMTEGYKRLMSMMVPYYKMELKESQTNIYGESLSKWYYQPVLMKCYLERSDENFEVGDYGPSNNQTMKVLFVREMLVQQNLLPEVGDIILDREKYYEVTNVNENHIMFGNDEKYIYGSPNFDSSSLQDRGESIMIEVDTTKVKPTKLNLLPYKLQ